MIAFITDVHVGNHRSLSGEYVGRINRRFKETVDILHKAALLCKERGCETLYILGDLFNRDDPSPPEVRAVRDALSAGIHVVILVGNHDKHSDVRHDNALSSLDRVPTGDGGYISVVEQPVVSFNYTSPVVLLPFRTGNATDWFKDYLAKAGPIPPKSLVGFHLGISDNYTEANEPWMMGSHDQVHVDFLSEIIYEKGLVGMLAGNWHKHMIWYGINGEPICQIGALVPTGWNNPGGDDLYGSVVFWDGQQMTREVVPGPRYYKFDSIDEWDKVGGSENVRSRIEVPADQLAAAKQEVEARVCMGYVEVIPSADSTKRNATEAARLAQKLATSTDSLSEYVMTCTMPDHIDRGAVLAKVRQHLGGE